MKKNFFRRAIRGVICGAIVTLGGLHSPGETPLSGGFEPNLRRTNDVHVYEVTKDAVVNISSTRVIDALDRVGMRFLIVFLGGR